MPRLGPVRAATTASPANPRIPALDGVRGLACLLVLSWHYVRGQVPAQPGTATAYALRCLDLNWSGVDLFFVLSGFLLGGILLDHREAPNLFRVFYARRACRILPLYFAWLGLFLVLRFATASGDPAVRGVFDGGSPTIATWAYATFLQNVAMALGNGFGPEWLSVTWSLAIEEQFYLILPLVIRFVPPRRLPRLLIVLALSAPALRLLSIRAFPGHGWALYVLLPCRWDSLFIGVLGAWAVRQDHYRTLMRRAPAVLPAVAIALLAGLVLFLRRSTAPISEAMQGLGYTWLACLYPQVA